MDTFAPEDNLGGTFAEESSFATLFPKYREVYLKEAWAGVKRAFSRLGIGCTLDLVEGQMSVRTTRATYDPAAILKARDVIRLLARSVPAPQALKALDDDVACDIIKTRGLVRNRERFVKRRQRLLGPGGSTLKALELLTGCYLLVQGNTVATMGPFRGLKEVRRVVEDCMHNIHPIYHVKELMIKRELAKDPLLAKENWDRFLPNFKKRSLSRRRQPYQVTEKAAKPYTPFPPPPQKSKIDLQIESGEFFLSKHAKERSKAEEKTALQQEKRASKQVARQAEYVPPIEPADDERPKKMRKRGKKKDRRVEEETAAD